VKIKEIFLNRKYLYAALVILILSVFSVILLQKSIRGPEIRFSEENVFQEKEFELTLHHSLFGGKIYYTLDGSVPTLQSQIYQSPILIASGEPVKATVVRAALYVNHKFQKVYTKTYFVGENVSELFDTMLVSLSADWEDLYSEDKGILTNYEMADENGTWQRKAFIEFYEPDGSLMLKQGTGIAVSGHGSRKFTQKSIKLIGSLRYDIDNPLFICDFFDTDMAGNQEGQSYNRLVLRNGGSDHEGTMIRWNVVSRLAKEAGMICAGARPGILFLNGEYYGIIQLQEKYTAYNVAAAIGGRKEDISKFEPNEINSARFGGYYNRLHADLNDPVRQEKLETSVDMDGMLQHYAVNLIMNNIDWPFHNFLSWKCANTGFSAYGDDKIRFFLYDLDAVYQDNTNSYNGVENIFDYLMQEPVEDMTDTLSILMKSDKYRTQFVNLVCDLTNSVFHEDNVLRIIDEENQKLSHSMELFYTDKQRERQKAAVDVMKERAQKSCAEVRERLERYLNASGEYLLKLEAPENAKISFSQITVEPQETYQGSYYHNYPLTLVAEPKKGYTFSCWVVNGKEIYEPQLLLDDSFQDEKLEIQLLIKH